MSKIAVMGCGAMGTVLGAYIAKAGVPVDLIDVNTAHVDALNTHGATIGGTVSMTTPVRALTPDRMEGVYDVVLYFVKQTYNETALAQLRPHTDDNTVICTLQNGFPELALEKVFKTENIMGCTVGWGATWVEPGVANLTSQPDKMECDLGQLNGQITDRLQKVKAILEHMCPINLVTNLRGARWTKLLVNSGWSGLSSVMGTQFGGILDDPKAFDILTFIANECIIVGDAAGHRMEPFFGHDIHAAFRFDDEKKRQSSFDLYRTIWTPHRGLTASMLQDLQKGLKCEIHAINGVVCETGGKYGIPTPFNDQVVAIIDDIQNGKKKYGRENLSLFDDILSKAFAALG